MMRERVIFATKDNKAIVYDLEYPKTPRITIQIGRAHV